MKKQLNRSELLGSLPVKRAVLMQILPAIASQMVALAYGIADTYCVGLLNDPDRSVQFYLDRDFEGGRIGVHPNDNTATVWMKTQDLIHLLRDYGTEVHVVPVEEVD